MTNSFETAADIADRPEVNEFCDRIDTILVEAVSSADDSDMQLAGVVQALDSAIMMLGALCGIEGARETVEAMLADLTEEDIAGITMSAH